MIPVTIHPLAVGTSVKFMLSKEARIRRGLISSPWPAGLQLGEAMVFVGRMRPWTYGVVEAVETVQEPDADLVTLALERIRYVIKAADGERERVLATRVSQASLLEVIAQASESPL